jgi:hypothetical protein
MFWPSLKEGEGVNVLKLNQRATVTTLLKRNTPKYESARITFELHTLKFIAEVANALLVAFMQGRLQRFARTGFKRLPSEHLQAALGRML